MDGQVTILGVSTVMQRVVKRALEMAPIDGKLTSTDPAERRQIESRGDAPVVLVGHQRGVGATVGALAGRDVSDPASSVLDAIGELLSDTEGSDVELPAGTRLAIQLERPVVLPARGTRTREPDAFTIYTSEETVRAAQEALRQRGYYRGPIDGQLSEPTQRALLGVQIDNDVLATGSLDGRTVELLDLPVSVAASLTTEEASFVRRTAQSLVTRWRDHVGISSEGRMDTRRTYERAEVNLYLRPLGLRRQRRALRTDRPHLGERRRARRRERGGGRVGPGCRRRQGGGAGPVPDGSDLEAGPARAGRPRPRVRTGVADHGNAPWTTRPATRVAGGVFGRREDDVVGRPSGLDPPGTVPVSGSGAGWWITGRAATRPRGGVAVVREEQIGIAWSHAEWITASLHPPDPPAAIAPSGVALRGGLVTVRAGAPHDLVPRIGADGKPSLHMGARSDVDDEGVVRPLFPGTADPATRRGAVHLGAGASVRIPWVAGWLHADWGIDPVDGASTISVAWVSGRSP